MEIPSFNTIRELPLRAAAFFIRMASQENMTEDLQPVQEAQPKLAESTHAVDRDYLRMGYSLRRTERHADRVHHRL
jgi:hypothetical protein